MNILLIQPSYYVDSKKHKKWRQLFPLLTMPTIAAYTPPGHNVEIIDDFTEEVDYNHDCDVVGITALTINAKRAYDIADEFRKRGKTVIMGGIHVSALPEEALEHCDSVINGEAEYCWPDVLNDIQNGKLKKIYKTESLHDMKGLPVPRYELLKTKSILSAVTLETTRGCPFDCDFCCVTQFYGKSFRFKPIDEVIDQIKYIKKKHKPSRFIFVDDNITAVKSHAEELFEKLIPLKIKWSGQTDVHVVKKKGLLDLAKKSGCTDLFMGIESINQASLNEINKPGNKVENYQHVFKTFKEHGITFHAGIILGLDGDDQESFKNTLKFVTENKIPYPTYSILTPYPGTRLRAKMVSEKRIVGSDWNNYYDGAVNYKPMLMSGEELVDGHKWLFEKTFAMNNILERCTFPLAPELFQTLVSNFYNFWKVKNGKRVWE